MIKGAKEYDNIIQPVNEIASEVNSVLNNRLKDRYFEKIVLLYSFIENILKWLVLVKTIWEKSGKGEVLGKQRWEKFKSFFKRLSFYNALNVAYSIDLIDFDLYRKIDAVRQERNNTLHQFWIYSHRNDFLVLRRRLEKLAKVTSQLVEILNQLTEEIGVEEVYQIFL